MLARRPPRYENCHKIAATVTACLAGQVNSSPQTDLTATSLLWVDEQAHTAHSTARPCRTSWPESRTFGDFQYNFQITLKA